jgi:hypothetical protein
MEKFGYSITWIGMGGMKWKHLINIILCMVNLSGIPDIILIHCGAKIIFMRCFHFIPPMPIHVML